MKKGKALIAYLFLAAACGAMPVMTVAMEGNREVSAERIFDAKILNGDKVRSYEEASGDEMLTAAGESVWIRLGEEDTEDPGELFAEDGTEDSAENSSEEGTEDHAENSPDGGMADYAEKFPHEGMEDPISNSSENGKEDAGDISVEARVETIAGSMSLEQKIAQLFVITPEALTGVDGVVNAGPVTREAFTAWPVGGLVYFENNLQSWEQTFDLLHGMQDISIQTIGLPVFLMVDEEGGSVRRISGRIGDVPYIEEMASVGSRADAAQSRKIGAQMGQYLAGLGFTTDLAPVADVLTNPDNWVIGSRSFGPDPFIDSVMVSAMVEGLREHGIQATLKHFPGHGNTYEDSHSGMAVTWKTLDELRTCEFIPFQSGIRSGAEFVMMGHISLPNVLGEDTPASLSGMMIRTILRGELGFDGIVITDALNMGAITQRYGSAQAAVMALQAGADLIAMPADFHAAYEGVCSAVYDQTLSEEIINTAVRRIIRAKLQMLDRWTGAEKAW